jgi:hypothetical protein
MEHVEDRLRAYLDEEAASLPPRDDLLDGAWQTARRQRRRHRTIAAGSFTGIAFLAAGGVSLAMTNMPWDRSGSASTVAQSSATETPVPTYSVSSRAVPRPACRLQNGTTYDYATPTYVPVEPAAQADRWRGEHQPTATELQVYVTERNHQYVTLSEPDDSPLAVLGYLSNGRGWLLETSVQCSPSAG